MTQVRTVPLRWSFTCHKCHATNDARTVACECGNRSYRATAQIFEEGKGLRIFLAICSLGISEIVFSLMAKPDPVIFMACGSCGRVPQSLPCGKCGEQHFGANLKFEPS